MVKIKSPLSIRCFLSCAIALQLMLFLLWLFWLAEKCLILSLQFTIVLAYQSNILTTTCQYEALKYVSFPVQTLAKCTKMIPVMVWGTLIMQKRYSGQDYIVAVLVTLGGGLFILYPLMVCFLTRSPEVFLTCLGSMASLAHFRTNYLRAMIWKFIIKYFTLLYVRAFPAFCPHDSRSSAYGY